MSSNSSKTQKDTNEQQPQKLICISDFPENYPEISFMTGKVPYFSCQADQRFSYCLYVPKLALRRPGLPLVVAIHGTRRYVEMYRNGLADLAESHKCIILAPLFPAGVIDPNDIHNYKLLKYKDVRFDQILFSMIDEVAERWRVDKRKFYMHGFSGGGQFVHRFFYLYPERLAAVSIGAPGKITLLDTSRKWPEGISNIETVFEGNCVNIEKLRCVPVHMVVGANDTGAIPEPGEEDSKVTRVEKLTSLRENFVSNGISVAFDKVPGMAHNGKQALPSVINFFGALIPKLL